MQDTAPPSPAAQAALDDCAGAAVELRRAYARLVGAVGALHSTDAVAQSGHRSLGRLIEEIVRVDPGEARCLVRHACLLTSDLAESAGPLVPDVDADGPRPPALPTTADACTEGVVGPEHVTVVAETMRRVHAVTPALPPAVVEETERQLAGLARERTPRALGEAAGEILQWLDPDGQAPHDSERPVEELRMSTGRDGVLTGRFRFAEPEAAEAIRVAIEARTPAPDPDADITVLHPGRELHERRGEALRALVDDAGPSRPADGEAAVVSLDDRPGRETTMIVTMPLRVLEGTGPGLGLLDGRYALTPEAARRLACDAAVVPAVLGSRGELLDLGRRTRVVSTAQRRAVTARDRHCAHPGCRRSARRCDVHHVIPWSRGGPTDLDNLVLLCPYHHHQVHHSEWEIRMHDGVPWFVPPAWLDPRRRPRRNRVVPAAAA